MDSKKKTSPFCSRSPYPIKKFTETEIVHYMEVEEVAEGFDSKKPSEFLINTKVVEYERIPIDEYVQSFASKVGLKNELKGIISKQQMDDYISAHKATPGFVDLTHLPDSPLEMQQQVERIDEIWASIPTELKEGLTKEEFIKTMNFDKLKAYVSSQIKSEEVENV